MNHLLRVAKNLSKKPSFVIALAFATTIVLGAVLLMLPCATHQGITFENAFFTSTSAVCVTGLVVVDTGSHFTIFGQMVILLLIQLGGLGILTFSAFFISMIKGRLDFTTRAWIEESLSHNHTVEVYHFLRSVIIFVLFVEVAGTVLIFMGLPTVGTWYERLFFSLFHSISAFCNAGFSTHNNSLVPFNTSLYLNTVFIFLIVIGGIGFVVIEDIHSRIRRKSKKLSFHTNVVLSTTITLIAIGTLFIFLVEGSRSFATFAWGDKLQAALFQSVTCRTAGFNTVSIVHLSEATLFFCIFLMFIGGSPGSTAGGIKTASFTLFLFLVISRLRGRMRPEIFRRTVPIKTIENTLTLLLLALLLIVVSILLLLISEGQSTYFAKDPRAFLTITFEVVSALGTVGLSMGITPYLTIFGKWVIILLMFLGRIGPLVLVVFLSGIQQTLDYEYPEEDIIVG